MDQNLKNFEILQKHKINGYELSQILHMNLQKNIHDAMIKGINSSSIGDVSWKIGQAGYKLKTFSQSVSNPNLMANKEDRVTNIDV